MSTTDLPFRYLSIRAVDVAVAVWSVLWIAVGAYAGMAILDLKTYSDTLDESGDALDTAGSALETIGAVPIIGSGPERLGNEVRATAEQVRISAAETRSSVDKLSLLIAVSIVFMPTTPVVALYAPWRVARSRQVDAITRALEQPAERPKLEEFLARRAVQHLPYGALHAVSDTPWKDLEDGRFRRLANAELTRLRLARPGGFEEHDAPDPDPDRA